LLKRNNFLADLSSGREADGKNKTYNEKKKEFSEKLLNDGNLVTIYLGGDPELRGISYTIRPWGVEEWLKDQSGGKYREKGSISGIMMSFLCAGW